MKPTTSDKRFKGFERPDLRVTKLAGGLTALGLTAMTVWTLGSGLSQPPEEIFTSRTNVELSLPYRGVCRELTVFSNGKELPTGYKDIKSGLARFSVDLEPGEHQLQVCFSTIVPGWSRTYDLVVDVDQSAPILSFQEGLPFLASPQTSTTSDSASFEGRVEVGARLLVGDQDLVVNDKGEFHQKVSLKPGWNNLLVRAEDKAGNRTLKKYSVFRDVRPPDVKWHTPPNHIFENAAARLEMDVSDDGSVAAVSATVDEQPVVWHRKPKDRWLGITPELSEGRHTVDVKIVDSAGRVTTSQRSLIVDSSEVLGEAVLGEGARGADVIALHQRLVDAGYLSQNLGNVFGQGTAVALRNFQADEGLEVTGRAEKASLIALGPRLYINLREFSLVLDRPGLPERRWKVASGSPEFPTPAGLYSVYEKVLEPTWLPPKSDWAKDAKPVEPGPDNPLGTRWIGFDWGGIGIHGTNAPWTIGSASSHGCLRMETSQVEELYSLIEVGTPVVVLSGTRDDPALDKYWPKS